jgi:hypothetical protein
MYARLLVVVRQHRLLNTIVEQGSMVLPSLDEFTGNWIEGQMVNGTLRRIGVENSPVYTGGFINGRKDGKGTLTLGDQVLYEGFWRDNKVSPMLLFATTWRHESCSCSVHFPVSWSRNPNLDRWLGVQRNLCTRQARRNRAHGVQQWRCVRGLLEQ